MKRLGITLLVCSCSVLAASKKKAKVEQPSALETYTKEATLRAKDPALREGSAGSLWNPAAGLADLAHGWHSTSRASAGTVPAFWSLLTLAAKSAMKHTSSKLAAVQFRIAAVLSA